MTRQATREWHIVKLVHQEAALTAKSDVGYRPIYSLAISSVVISHRPVHVCGPSYHHQTIKAQLT